MAQRTTVCLRCNAPLDEDSKFCATCGASVSDAGTSQEVAAPGDDLFELLVHATIGEYEIKGELGRGGMAAVFLAHEIALDRKVAIKVLPPEFTYGAGMIERFKREAKTSAQLTHPHIIPIYRVKEAGRTLYFVMKYVEGRSLEGIIEEAGRLPIPMVHVILSQVGSALGYAHRRGVIHRDVKPANIMIDEEGWAVVTDFGIAKAMHAPTLTATGAAIGTPFYMSPEQCTGKGVSGASDQYSLGIVAYQMLAGTVPFKGDSIAEIMKQHFMDTPADLASLRSDCPEAMVSAIHRALAKDPAERFRTIEDFMAAIAAAAPSENQAVRSQMIEFAKSGSKTALVMPATPRSPIPMERGPAAAPGTRERRSTTLPEPARRIEAARTRRWMWAAALVAVPLLGVGTWLGLRRTGLLAPADQVTAMADSGAGQPAPSESAPASVAAPAESASGVPETPAAPDSTRGTVIIRNLPPNAVARIDGRQVNPRGAQTPVGSRLLEVTAPGFQTLVQRIRVSAARQLVVRAQLEPAPAAPQTAQPGAPAAPTAQPAAPQAPAPQPQARETTAAPLAQPPARAAERTPANPPPVAPDEPGLLTVGARPLGSATLNNQPIPRWPAVNLPLLPGTYRLVVRASGYQDWDSTFVMRPGQRINLRTIVLKREGEP